MDSVHQDLSQLSRVTHKNMHSISLKCHVVHGVVRNKEETKSEMPYVSCFTLKH